MMRKPPSFSFKTVTRKCGNYNLCLEGGLVSLKTCSEEGLAQQFGGFFSSNKSAPANRKRGFYKPSAEE
jgi:hypothetical protein